MSGVGLMRPHSKLGAAANWGLPGQGESIFFRGVALGGLPCSSGWHHTHVHKNSTKLTQWVFKKKKPTCKGLGLKVEAGGLQTHPLWDLISNNVKGNVESFGKLTTWPEKQCMPWSSQAGWCCWPQEGYREATVFVPGPWKSCLRSSHQISKATRAWKCSHTDLFQRLYWMSASQNRAMGVPAPLKAQRNTPRLQWLWLRQAQVQWYWQQNLAPSKGCQLCTPAEYISYRMMEASAKIPSKRESLQLGLRKVNCEVWMPPRMQRCQHGAKPPIASCRQPANTCSRDKSHAMNEVRGAKHPNPGNPLSPTD